MQLMLLNSMKRNQKRLRNVCLELVRWFILYIFANFYSISRFLKHLLEILVAD